MSHGDHGAECAGDNMLFLRNDDGGIVISNVLATNGGKLGVLASQQSYLCKGNA